MKELPPKKQFLGQNYKIKDTNVDAKLKQHKVNIIVKIFKLDQFSKLITKL